MTTPTLPPHPLGPDAFVIQSFHQAPGAPVGVHLNSMVLRSQEPVLFDTGAAVFGDSWLDAVASVVDPTDVRWIVVTHDDPDHVGNVERAMAACPRATLVASWFICERMGAEAALDPTRLRWVDADGTLDIGDRTLAFVRPPLYDNPTTRVVLDTKSRTLWAADLGAVPMPGPAADAEELPADALAEGFLMFQRVASPWYEMVAPERLRAEVDAFAALDVAAFASCHGPAFRGGMVDVAMDLLREVPDAPLPQTPGQADLDAMVAQALVATG